MDFAWLQAWEGGAGEAGGHTNSAHTLVILRGLHPTAFSHVLNFPPWFTVNAGTRSPRAAEK